jgi:hypothetical protein
MKISWSIIYEIGRESEKEQLYQYVSRHGREIT